MATFSPVTDTDLARARRDPAFRQRLLAHSLETLLEAMQRVRGATRSVDGDGAKQLREGAELAVRLAVLIQKSGVRRAS